MEPQPLSNKIWGFPVSENFKSSSVAKFDGKSDLQEYVVSTNMQMTIIGASDSLKCKLFSSCECIFLLEMF